MNKASERVAKRTLLGIVIMCWGFLASGGEAALAQGSIDRWLGPDLRAIPTTIRLETEYYPNTKVQGQSTSLDVNYQRLDTLMPFWQNRKNQLVGSILVEHIHQSSEARLMDSDQPFPNSLANLQFGLHYRRSMDNGHVFGVSGAVGSPSDKLFAGGDLTSWDFTFFWRYPTSPAGAALIMINYSNHRDFWNGIPTPGLAYYYRPHERFTGIFGWPFTRIVWAPNPRHSLGFFWRWPWNTTLRYTLTFTKALQMYSGFTWHNRRYFLEKKLKSGDQFFNWEKRVFLGVKAGLVDQLFLDLSAGYVFDRYYFQGESYDTDRSDRVDVDSNYYIMGGISGYF